MDITTLVENLDFSKGKIVSVCYFEIFWDNVPT